MAFEILDHAWKEGIHLLDSAEAYGDSIQVIGAYMASRKSRKFSVISKFLYENVSLSEKCRAALNNLSVDHLYGYMYHRFGDYVSEKYRSDLLRLKAEKKIERIGVSVYSLTELKAVISDTAVDIIQVPFNPFDSDGEKILLLKDAKSRGKEIHARSIFLQGLFFKEPSELTGNLMVMAAPLQRLKDIIKNSRFNITEVCLNYALHQDFIDYVIIGVETPKQLSENLSALMVEFPQGLSDSLREFSIEDKALLNPSNWKSY